ncbi:hypothetical protein [Desulfovibrio piger]|uniref:hypothetical protein n=1 Tax=Desulfovibrio piger TaxID=901 RepID=UPI003076B842
MDIRAKNNEELLKRIGEVLTDDSKFFMVGMQWFDGSDGVRVLTFCGGIGAMEEHVHDLSPSFVAHMVRALKQRAKAPAPSTH